MKYTLAFLAVVAAVVALFVRPPQLGQSPSVDVHARTGPADRPLAAEPLSGGSPPPAGKRSARSRGVVVYVAGEVRLPGVYTLATDARANDALARAGGPLADADLVAVNLAAPLIDGAEIAVPKIGATTSRVRSARAQTPHRERKRGRRQRRSSSDESDATPVEPLSVDLNTADEAALEALPGIGKALAARIIAYREDNGRFATLDELADVAGITQSVQDRLERYVFVR